MTPEQYESRIADLGFETGAAWAEYAGIDRATHHRHVSEDRIPRALQLLVEMLEVTPEKNPNTGRASCPKTMELLK